MAATSNPPSNSRLSTRISLRWLPEPAFENTDTIVMSVKGWYVDLRVDRTSGDIDWAIAGQRVVDSQEPRVYPMFVLALASTDKEKGCVQFTHEIDSHNSFDAVDCGEFSTLPNGDDLEVGSMPRPDVPGAPVTKYEEVWRELAFRVGPEGPGCGVSWVLESKVPVLEEGIEVRVSRTFIGRIWGTYLALCQEQTLVRAKGSEAASVTEGRTVSARREEWNRSSGWSAEYVLGEEGENLPSMVNITGEGSTEWRTPGATVTIQGESYIVRSFEEIV